MKRKNNSPADQGRAPRFMIGARAAAPQRWIMALVLSAALVLVGYLALTPGASGGHPHPRSDASAAKVLGDADLVLHRDARPAYAAARAYPAVLDGLKCYCHCENLGHRSLLSCFEDLHGAECYVCQVEALIAAKMRAEGAELGEIRGAVDARFLPPGG